MVCIAASWTHEAWQSADLMYGGALTAKARKDYIKAVKCMTRKPAKSSKTDVPGARSRFDDWVAVHIKLTNNVHFSVRLTLVHYPSTPAPFAVAPMKARSTVPKS